MRKTHPLAARIKRLMQKDEEVGKIAQATPVVIGEGACFPPVLGLLMSLGVTMTLSRSIPAARALEVFLQRLCEKSSQVAVSRGAKTVTASHL